MFTAQPRFCLTSFLKKMVLPTEALSLSKCKKIYVPFSVRCDLYSCLKPSADAKTQVSKQRLKYSCNLFVQLLKFTFAFSVERGNIIIFFNAIKYRRCNGAGRRLLRDASNVSCSVRKLLGLVSWMQSDGFPICS